jgi:hypothetical protein
LELLKIGSRIRLPKRGVIKVFRCELKFDENKVYKNGYTEIDIGKLIGDNPLTVRKTYAHFIPSTRQEMVNYYHEMNEKIMNFKQK